MEAHDTRRDGQSSVSASGRSRELSWGELVATSDPIEVAAGIVAAFVSYNALPISELPTLLESVHSAVNRASGSGEITETVTTPPHRRSRSASQLRQTINLFRGRPTIQIDAAASRIARNDARSVPREMGLPPTYPMVAPTYAAQRSAMAKHIGLGQCARSRAGPSQSRHKGQA